MAQLKVTRKQVLAFRRRVGALDERLPRSAASLRQAAWAGLQDSMPRAALLSLHARVEGAESSTWEHPSLAQLWGPRYQVYVVPKRDFALFSLARLPEDEKGRLRAEEMAKRLHGQLSGRRMTDREAGSALGIGNELRYATTTGTIAIRWGGARAPELWTVPAAKIDPADARRELARRYLHVFGPATADGFARWAGISRRSAAAAFASLEASLVPVRSPLGDEWLLPEDEPAIRAGAPTPAPARLLPSGDAYFLLWGADRELLVPREDQRERLWTSRVWPGALLVGGEIRGTWRRAQHVVTIDAWGRLSRATRGAVEAEADALPLPGLDRPVEVVWDT
ncbi:MAG: DNA glycosylase AlkZ-like family protein [Gaiellaceae bacterium]